MLVWVYPDSAVTGCLSGSQIWLVQLGQEEAAGSTSDLAVVGAPAPHAVDGLESAVLGGGHEGG